MTISTLRSSRAIQLLVAVGAAAAMSGGAAAIAADDAEAARCDLRAPMWPLACGDGDPAPLHP